MKFSFDSRTFEDVHYALSKLGEFLSSAYPQKAKDPQLAVLIKEARIQAFLTCHHALTQFLLSMDENPDHKKEKTLEQVLLPLIRQLHEARIVTSDQVSVLLEQFESAVILSYDFFWLDKEQQALFQERAKRIPRYHYLMSSIMSFLGQRVFLTKGPEHATAHE